MTAAIRERLPASGRWCLVGLLAAGLASDYVSRLGLNSILPILRTDLGISDVEIGLLASVFLWTYGFLSPFAGFAGDRLSRRGIIVVSIIAWSTVTILCTFVTRPWQLIILRAALAAAQVCYIPAAQALIADFHRSDTHSKAVGLYQGGAYGGILLSGLPIAHLSTRIGWRNALLACGCAGLALAWAMQKWLPRHTGLPDAATRERGQVSATEVISVIKVPAVVVVMVAFALASAAFWIVTTFLPLFVYEHSRVSLEAAAFRATFYAQVSGLVTMPLFGALSDRWTMRAARNRFVVCAVVAIAGAPAVLAIGLGNSGAALISGLLLLGIANAATDASWMPMLCNVTYPYQRATAYGILNMASCLAGGIAAFGTALIMGSVGLGSIIASLWVLFVALSGLILLTGFVMPPCGPAIQPSGRTR